MPYVPGVTNPSRLTLHALGPSHPCRTPEAALRRKGLECERVELEPGRHNKEMERLYGPDRRTVPGLLVDGEPVHGSRAILGRLEQLVLQIGATLRVLLGLGDPRPLLAGRPDEAVARRWFPAGWVPSRG
jgi:glutaredoxin